MARPRMSRPTDAELEVLRVLWRYGPSTVRQVHEKLSRDRGVGYTATLSLMQVMAQKRLLERDEARRSHVYRPKLKEERTQQQFVREIIKRVFGGSARTLIVRALAEGSVSAEEMAEIHRLIESHKRRGGGS